MMYNCYKRRDIFICRHEAHRCFEHRVSAYHVLHEKQCYPGGCLDFIWKCKLLGKGGSCPKGYGHVGNNCTNCRYYDEEKVQRYPELQISEANYNQFLDDCERFNEWLDDHAGRLLEVGGLVTDIRPNLVRRIDGRRSHLSLRGFLVRLQPGYIDRDGFEDALYLRISPGQQRRQQLATGDRIEALGFVRFDRGRIVIREPRRLQVDQRSGEEAAAWDQALLDRLGAVSLKGRPGRCLQCERGVLIDIEDAAGGRHGPRREVLCLEGIGRPDECPYEVIQQMRKMDDRSASTP
jgi:hypothetical protein